MHKETIKAAIRIAYESVGAFERARSLPKGSVSDVLRGRSVRQTQDAIAEFVKRPVTDLFPRRKGSAESERAEGTSEMSDAHRLNAGAR